MARPEVAQRASDEDAVTLVQPDPTWEIEYEHFKRLCETGANNIENDIWINEILADLTQQVLKPPI